MVGMLRAYVVDDERLAVDRLTRLLERTGRVQIVGKASDPEEALSFLNANPGVDVLFLDIQMPGLTGFQMLEKLERQLVLREEMRDACDVEQRRSLADA